MKTPQAKIFYSLSNGEIESGMMTGIEGSGRKQIVRFSDGGWCRLEDCFLTESQCRKNNKLPPKNWKAINDSIADKLEKLAEQIKTK